MKRQPQYKKGRLTADEEEKIVALADRLGPGPIALRLNRHPATVNFAMYRLGVHKPVKPKGGAGVYHRHGVTVRAFSAEEDAFIEERRAAGVPVRGIVEQLEARFGHRRAPHSIRVRLIMLASKEAA